MSQELLIPDTKKSGALSEIGQSREAAEIQAAMLLAKRFPRDYDAAMNKILDACSRPGLADGALYSYTRGGAEVTGPSIRLAEAIAQNWGNIQFGVRELEQDRAGSTVEAFAFDLESNTRQVKVFHVPHERHTKSGKKPLTDPRDIYENVANQGARRLRACILGVIPSDVIAAATNQCEVTLKANADVSPETIARLIDSFAKFGVTAEQIGKRIGKNLDAINSANIVQLKKIYQSLRDGMSQPADWFEMNSAASELNNAIGGGDR